MTTFKKILIANRGEIAVRIIRTAREMGIRTLAIYTDADKHSLHVDQADESVLLSGQSLSDSYLNQKKIIQIALENGVDAIHPGYGFLAENADFAEAVLEAGIQFIGPTPEQIRLMGQKHKAVDLAESLGIPVLNSVKATKNKLLQAGLKLGLPLMVKAVAGGGGKGMFIISSEAGLSTAIEKAERQALEYFGNGDLMLEKYVPNARHIEVQLLGDNFGNLVHLYERECSIQRRFQKIVEEAPSVSVSNDLREKICSAALTIGRKVDYQGLGTVEFLVDEDQNFWFLEMNTRIQVEHPVTEAITGLDLVRQQILVAAGNKLKLQQSDIKLNGHSIETRICAENTDHDFRPATGIIQQLNFPEKDGFRTEHFLQEGTTISADYDSLLAKQIVHAENRKHAIDLLKSGLEETKLKGMKTNIPFLLQLLNDQRFQQNEISTSFLNDFEIAKQQDLAPIVAAYIFFYLLKKAENQRNIWQNIGFNASSLYFRIWIDETEYNGIITTKPNGIELTFQDTTKFFQQKGISKDKMLLVSENREYVVFINDQKWSAEVYFCGRTFELRSNLVSNHVKIEKQLVKDKKHFQEQIYSDLYGKILTVAVKHGDKTGEGEVLLVLESMKTEFKILCPQNSVVKNVLVQPGDRIKDGQLLVELSEESHSMQCQFSENTDNNISGDEALRLKIQ